jgi:hypothetical protein
MKRLLLSPCNASGYAASRRVPESLVVFLAAACAAAACKGDKGKAAASGSGSGSGSALAPLPVPPLGVDEVGRFNYEYGKGADGYKKARAAYKAKDWAAVRAATAAAIDADPYHLDAHHLRAVAEAQLGKPAEAVGHLATILAHDYFKFHDLLAADADLATFRTTPYGAALETLDKTLGDQVKASLARSVVVIARRGAFKWPSKPGAQWATTRGEVYAMDLDTKRMLRLTHTGHAVAAMLRSPSGEVAVLGYDKVEMPEPTDKTSPPILARAWVEAYDGTTWAPTTKRATIAKGRAAAVTFGAGDQLLVASIAARGRWELGAATWSSVDRSTGKTTKTAAPGPTLTGAVVTLDDAWVEGEVPGVKGEWTPATATTPALAKRLELPGGKAIDVPESGQTGRDSIAVSPGAKQVAFATYTDPCAKDAKRSLYVVDAGTGQLKHLLTDASRFRSRWIDDARLVYEDGKGHLRIWSAADKRELARIDDKYGLALVALSSSLAPLCKTAPPVVEPDTGGEETEGPTETEGTGTGSDAVEPGPVTTP